MSAVLRALLGLLFFPAWARAVCEISVATADDVIAAMFAPESGCDIDADGRTTAADLVALLRLRFPPPTATSTPSHSPSPTATPHFSPAPTGTATATPTPGPTVCSETGGSLALDVENHTARDRVVVRLRGRRLEEVCEAGGLASSYDVEVGCDGAVAEPCAIVGGLAPGPWLHTFEVTDPPTGQRQHRTSLVLAGEVFPDRLRFRVFPSVFFVTSAEDGGPGSLREVLGEISEAPKPALVLFDEGVFPAGVPTVILLRSQLPPLATDDVTIDAIDGAGARGNRIVDAAGLPIPALVVTGARNHILGLALRNAGGNERDVLNLRGPSAWGNLLESLVVEGAATADGIGVDDGAGSSFETANVVRDSEVRGAADKGVKVTTGAFARIERSWIHDNRNGGIQATLGGHVQAYLNVVDDNAGASAQNGLAVNPSGEGSAEAPSELRAWGNLTRRNGASGVSVRGASVAEIRDHYSAVNETTGIRVDDVGGVGPTVRVEGTSAVCNRADGVAVFGTGTVDFGGGPLGSPGDNAFTQNNLPVDANFRNATGRTVDAVGNQWEHCGTGPVCDHDEILRLDVNDLGRPFTRVAPAQAHRRGERPRILGVSPSKGRKGELLRIFGSAFNVIDGHFAEDRCEDVEGRNRCVPLRGNCVRIGGVPAPVVAVTPTMLVVRFPFTCTAPVELTVTTDQGPTGLTSEPFRVCTNSPPLLEPPREAEAFAFGTHSR
ncbi:MAG: hypothetical protein KatS3mg076_2628 [Candidatus Binatia bacterium]|nr:MAG: hypothetical protein KatS3mg076_2628 [Candidatus Binatia bacterium]